MRLALLAALERRLISDKGLLELCLRPLQEAFLALVYRQHRLVREVQALPRCTHGGGLELWRGHVLHAVVRLVIFIEEEVRRLVLDLRR